MASIKGSRIYQQIESSADYYEPSVYAGLQFSSLFQAMEDPATQDFIPVTSPAAYKFGDPGYNSKIFAVGLLPPTCNISSRLIDRSGSVANIQGGVGAADLGADDMKGGGTTSGGVQKYGGIVTAPGYKIPKGTGTSNPGVGISAGVTGCADTVAVEYLGNGKYKYNCVANVSIKEMYQGFHNAYVNKFGKEPSPTEIQFLTAHCFRETGGHMPGNNPGYIGNRPTNPGGWVGFQEPDPNNPGSTRVRWFKGYDSVEAGCEAYLNVVGRNPNVLAAARDGDVLGYLTSLAQQEYFGEAISQYYNNYGKGGGWPNLLNMVAAAVPEAGLGRADGLPKNVPDSCAFKETSAQYKKRAKDSGLRSGAAAISRFNKNSPYGPDCPLEAETQSDNEYKTPDWEGKGAANAKDAAKQEAKTAGMDLNRTELGQKFLYAQAAEINYTLQQLETMRNTPPLRMLVNPASFEVAAEKIVADSNWTRNGPVIEHWGDGQDKITGSGKISGFYAIDTQDANGPGLSRTTRNYSMAYQNFLSLWLLYRSNAGLFLPTFASDRGDIINILSVLGSIYIYYDGIIYIGSFDSFNVNETDTAPFTLEYDFSFTVRAWYELDRADPAQYQYGNTTGMFKQGGIPVAPDTTKTYEAAQAAGEARKEKAAEVVQQRKAVDDLFRSPDEVMGPSSGKPTIPTTKR
jgi:hypothetical protein